MSNSPRVFPSRASQDQGAWELEAFRSFQGLATLRISEPALRGGLGGFGGDGGYLRHQETLALTAMDSEGLNPRSSVDPFMDGFFCISRAVKAHLTSAAGPLPAEACRQGFAPIRTAHNAHLIHCPLGYTVL